MVFYRYFDIIFCHNPFIVTTDKQYTSTFLFLTAFS
jgi:hypothetical protein